MRRAFFMSLARASPPPTSASAPAPSESCGVAEQAQRKVSDARREATEGGTARGGTVFGSHQLRVDALEDGEHLVRRGVLRGLKGRGLRQRVGCGRQSRASRGWSSSCSRERLRQIKRWGVAHLGGGDDGESGEELVEHLGMRICAGRCASVHRGSGSRWGHSAGQRARSPGKPHPRRRAGPRRWRRGQGRDGKRGSASRAPPDPATRRPRPARSRPRPCVPSRCRRALSCLNRRSGWASAHNCQTRSGGGKSRMIVALGFYQLNPNP